MAGTASTASFESLEGASTGEEEEAEVDGGTAATDEMAAERRSNNSFFLPVVSNPKFFKACFNFFTVYFFMTATVRVASSSFSVRFRLEDMCSNTSGKES